MSEHIRAFMRLSELETEHFTHGKSYESHDASIAKPLGLTKIGATYTRVPPGKTACPYHVHHGEDELFIILSGTGEYRFGESRHQVGAGDVLGAPVGGPEYAHQLWNNGEEPLVYIGISNKADIEVVEYPDTQKIMSMSKGKHVHRHMSYASAHVDYFDGDPDV